MLSWINAVHRTEEKNLGGREVNQASWRITIYASSSSDQRISVVISLPSRVLFLYSTQAQMPWHIRYFPVLRIQTGLKMLDAIGRKYAKKGSCVLASEKLLWYFNLSLRGILANFRGKATRHLTVLFLFERNYHVLFHVLYLSALVDKCVDQCSIPVEEGKRIRTSETPSLSHHGNYGVVATGLCTDRPMGISSFNGKSSVRYHPSLSGSKVWVMTVKSAAWLLNVTSSGPRESWKCLEHGACVETGEQRSFAPYFGMKTFLLWMQSLKVVTDQVHLTYWGNSFIYAKFSPIISMFM